MPSLLAPPMRQFSIIVPVLGSQPEFEKTLGSVLRYVPAGSEVIVPCPEDFVDAHGLEGEVELVRLPTGEKADLPRLFRAAVQQAGKELVCLFLPGTEISDGWNQIVSPRFDDSMVGSVSPVLLPTDSATVGFPTRGGISGMRLDRRQSRRIVHAAKRRSDLQIDGPTGLAGVFRNDAFGWLELEQTGLSADSLDIELTAGLRCLGYRSVGLADWMVTCDSSLLGQWKKSQLGGLEHERIHRRHSENGVGGMSLRILLDAVLGKPASGLGRVLAFGHSRQDREFNQRLMQGKLEREKLIQAISSRRKESETAVKVQRAA